MAGSDMGFESTIAGSLPKPAWLATRDQLWAGWRSQGDELAEAKRDALQLAVAEQERAGVDIVSDGEQTRQHFVTTFIEGLDGVDAETGPRFESGSGTTRRFPESSGPYRAAARSLSTICFFSVPSPTARSKLSCRAR